MTTEALTALLLLAGLWSVLCRINQMHAGRTQPLVFLQHMVLGVGMAAALFMPAATAKLCLAAGLLVYLLAGAARWRYAAPPGTETQPAALDELEPETRI